MAKAVLLDIDGVLTVSWRALPGAAQTLGWLGEHEIEFRLVTNTSSRTRREIVDLLAEAGMDVPADHVLTAVTAAGRYLTANYPDLGCFVVNDGGDLSEDLGVQPVGAPDAGVVLLGGAGPGVNYQDLDTAFRLTDAGVPVIALHRNTRFQTSDGPSLDMGAFLIGLEAATEISALTIVGKPAEPFFRAALDELGADPAGTLMVGDDLGADVQGAQALGISGVLVRTGKFRPSDLKGADPAPDHVIDGIGDLPTLLG